MFNPHTRTVAYWHISNISSRISYGQFCCNIPILYIAAIFWNISIQLVVGCSAYKLIYIARENICEIGLLLPPYISCDILFSMCIHSEGVFLQLFSMMLSVCFYIRYIPNLLCYHDHIDASFDSFYANTSFEVFPLFTRICSYFFAIESYHWSFVQFQRTVKWCL